MGTVSVSAGGAGLDTSADVTVEVGSVEGAGILLDVGDVDLDSVDDIAADGSVWPFGGRGWQP